MGGGIYGLGSGRELGRGLAEGEGLDLVAGLRPWAQWRRDPEGEGGSGSFSGLGFLSGMALSNSN